MIRLWTDFNALSESEQAWLLVLNGQTIEDPALLGLSVGDRVLLFQEDDFEVEAVLEIGVPEAPAPAVSGWFAQVDWSTLRRF